MLASGLSVLIVVSECQIKCNACVWFLVNVKQGFNALVHQLSDRVFGLREICPDTVLGLGKTCLKELLPCLVFFSRFSLWPIVV